MDVNSIVTFVQIAHAPSLSSGARDIGKAKSTVSSQIASLEARLGFFLFRRTTRKLVLTREGREYLEAVKPSVEMLLSNDQRLANIHSGLAGRLRVVAPSEIPLTPIAQAIGEFTQKHPDVQIDFRLSNEIVDFADGDVDIAVRGGSPTSQDTVVKKLGDIEFAFCASPTFLSKHQHVSEASSLPVSEHIGFAVEFSEQRSIHLQQPTTVSRNEAAIMSNSMLFNLRVALTGAGVAQVPLYLAKEAIEAGDLVELHYSENRPRSLLSIQFPSRREANPLVRALARSLERAIRNSSILCKD